MESVGSDAWKEIALADFREALEKIDFDILALGEDHRGGRFDECVKWCEEHGKEVVRLKRTPNICSSDIKKELSRS